MAGIGTFKSLKTHGEKIAKFQQRKHIGNPGAVMESLKAFNDFGAWESQEGTCAALSIEFIKQVFSSQANPFVPITDFVPKSSGIISKNENTYNKSIPTQLKYMVDFKSNPALAHKNIISGAQLNCGLRDPNYKDDKSSFSADLINIAKFVKPKSFAYIGYRLKERSSKKPAGHAIVIGKWGDDVIFFDANVGAYLIKDANVVKFFAEYVVILETFWEDISRNLLEWIIKL